MGTSHDCERNGDITLSATKAVYIVGRWVVGPIHRDLGEEVARFGSLSAHRMVVAPSDTTAGEQEVVLITIVSHCVVPG